MTRQEALDKAQTRVWCYMTRESIDYNFEQYGLKVIGSDGKKKSRPSRSEKEDALIEYLTDKFTTQDDEVVEKQQQAYETRFKHFIEDVTGSPCN